MKALLIMQQAALKVNQILSLEGPDTGRRTFSEQGLLQGHISAVNRMLCFKCLFQLQDSSG